MVSSGGNFTAPLGIAIVPSLVPAPSVLLLVLSAVGVVAIRFLTGLSSAL
jgi:hypothetical protein